MSSDPRQLAHLPIARILAQVDEWQESTQIGIPPVERGSDLDGDRSMCPAYPVADLAWTAIGSAIDHLSAFAHLVRTKTLHLYAPFTILRSSIETASLAIWLLAPDDRIQRIKNVLKAEHQNAIQLVDYVRLLPDQNSEANSRRQQRPGKIRAEAKRLRISESTVAGRWSMSRIVAAAGRWLLMDGDMGAKSNEVIWRACSGLAHGHRWAIMTMTSIDAMARVEGGYQVQVTSNEELLVYALDRAHLLTAGALGLYERRRKAIATASSGGPGAASS